MAKKKIEAVEEVIEESETIEPTEPVEETTVEEPIEEPAPVEKVIKEEPKQPEPQESVVEEVEPLILPKEPTLKVEQEVKEKPTFGFGFAQGLLQGHARLSRKSWKNGVYLSNATAGIMEETPAPDALDNIKRSYTFTAEDRIATDWYVVE